MATTHTEIQSQVIGLSAEAFRAFCEDISGMFDVDMECSQQEFCTESVKKLKKRFKKLAAVNSIKSEGTLNGNFQIVFNKEGLFTLAGVIVMLPEQKILDNRKRGSTKEAEEMSDAVGEVGNMLVESWDRIFRNELKGHGHFVQTNTFIGNPWGSPEEKIGLAGDEEFLFVPYEMTISSYPTFNCGVIFPKTIFGDTSVSDAEAAAAEDEKSQKEPKDPQDAGEKADSNEPDTTGKNDSEESKSKPPADEKTVESGDKTAEQPVETEQETSAENRTEAEEAIAEETAEVETEPEETSEPAGQTDGTEPATGPVSETIQRMAQSPADLPGGGDLVSLAMCAQDIMEKDVVWGDGEDSVEQALTTMQEADAGYMMVGTEGSLDGIVSTFDIASVLSVYLKPMFSKWHRPIDDATLQIKIKWIMSRPVRTIQPDTSLAEIMENMRQTGLRCLPVADQQGNVAGLVTVFDIFKALLNSDSDISTAGKTPEAPSLV